MTPTTGKTGSIRALPGLPSRVGQTLTAPDAALTRVEADGGGLRDALALVFVAVVAFRLPELVHAVLNIAGPTSGAVMGLIALFAGEARHAAWFVLPAAVVVTFLARERRDAGRDLDLGAACYPPVFVAAALERVLSALTGPQPFYGTAADAIGAAGVAVLVWRAVRVARSRPVPKKTVEPTAAPVEPAPSAAPARPARLVGGAVLALALAATVQGAVWSAHNFDGLRPIARGQSAPDFSLPRIDATPGVVALRALRGQVVVLDFWATWCGPCVQMIPVLDAVHHDWAGRGVSFVGVNSDGRGATADDIKAFLIEHPMPYPVVRDGDSEVGGLYRVERLPTLVIIGRDGSVRKSFEGYTLKGTLDKALRDAVEAQPQP
jgi:thiol-disulfide isomerase/thioredoxin